MTQPDILLDISRRHSPMHKVDKHATEAFAALMDIRQVCWSNDLMAEHIAAVEALRALHRKAKQRWESGQ